MSWCAPRVDCTSLRESPASHTPGLSPRQACASHARLATLAGSALGEFSREEWAELWLGALRGLGALALDRSVRAQDVAIVALQVQHPAPSAIPREIRFAIPAELSPTRSVPIVRQRALLDSAMRDAHIQIAPDDWASQFERAFEQAADQSENQRRD